MTAAAVLHGRTVAITRPEPGELGARLAALGATVIHVPLIATRAAPDGGVALAEALARLAQFDWLIVTSANGARAVGVAAGAVPGVRLAAVGPATANALAELAGRPVDLVPAAARAEGLLEEFPPGPARVLLAQADQARPRARRGVARCRPRRGGRRRLPDGGAAAVGRRDRRVGGAPTPWCWPAAPPLAPTPPRSAHERAAGPPFVVCIGPVTADAARAAGLEVDHVADHPDPTTLTTLLTTALVTP